MKTSSEWSDAFSAALSQFTDRLGQFLPNLAGAVLLLVAGWFVARLMRGLAVRLARMLERALMRISYGRGVEGPKLMSATTQVLGNIVFWTVMLFFLVVSAQVLGLDAFLGWLNRVVVYLPTLFTGILIILAGYLISALVKDLVIATAAKAGERQRMLLGRAAQTLILVTAIVIGADQVGIRVTFLVIMVTVIAASVLGGVAVAVSLGARTYVANLIGSHTMRRAFSVGQSVRVKGFEGRILEITATTVVLETADGRVSIPAKAFHDEPMTLLMGGDRGEQST